MRPDASEPRWSFVAMGLTGSLRWGALSLAPHVLWELAHLPLYSSWTTDSPATLAYAIAHCTLGDGLIAAVTYGCAAVGLRSADWPRTAALAGLTILTGLGVGYTVWSEYYNVHLAARWAYGPAMPTVWGVGATPLLQWLLLPAVTLWLWQRWSRTRGSSHRQK